MGVVAGDDPRTSRGGRATVGCWGSRQAASTSHGWCGFCCESTSGLSAPIPRAVHRLWVDDERYLVSAAALASLVGESSTPSEESMFCPECGFDAQDAKFCPECGAGLDRFRSSIDDDFDDAPRREPRPAARTSGALGGKRSGGSRPPARGPRPRAAARASEEYREPSRPATESRLSPVCLLYTSPSPRD